MELGGLCYDDTNEKDEVSQTSIIQGNIMKIGIQCHLYIVIDNMVFSNVSTCMLPLVWQFNYHHS